MRIAFLVKVFPPRHETFILNQLHGLCERGLEVDVIAQRRGEAQSPDYGDSAPQYRVLYREQEAAQRSSRIGKVLSRAGRLLGRSSANGRDGQQNSDAKLFQTGDPYDIVHCQYMTLGAAAVALRDAGVFNAPIVTSVRGFDITRRSARDVAGFDALLERGDLFLPVCDSFRERLIELGVSPDRIVVHRSGIDLSKFGLRKGTRPRLCDNVATLPIPILFGARLPSQSNSRAGARANPRGCPLAILPSQGILNSTTAILRHAIPSSHEARYAPRSARLGRSTRPSEREMTCNGPGKYDRIPFRDDVLSNA